LKVQGLFCNALKGHFTLKTNIFHHTLLCEDNHFFYTFAAIKKSEVSMFENLSDRLERSFKLLKGQGKITEINIAETLKEIRKALLDADVNFKIAKTFTDTVKEKAMGMDVLTSVKPGQLMVKLVHDELAELMGGKYSDINLKGSPAIILMAGLQGSGKTTFAGKLANMLKHKKGRHPLLVAGDVYRPAAIEQLKILGTQIGVEVFTEEGNLNPVKIAQNAIKHARLNGFDVVIVDTAGRLAIDEQMMNEIASLKKELQPQEILFVVDAMTGQDAVNTAKEFNDRLDFDGVILTKLDGDTRGGAALSIRSVVDKPIKFVGSGEKMEAIEVFHPDRMADRILGMGDIVSLVEKAQEQFDSEEAKRIQQRLARDQFNFNDFLKQIQQIKKMGNIKDVASMIPGMGKALKNVDMDNDSFKHIEAIIYSMTPKERENPSLLNGSRRKRIADGSGTEIQEVNRLLKQFSETSKMMKAVAQGKNLQHLMGNMQQGRR
jgi:signal recognition particle subunit SRP54